MNSLTSKFRVHFSDEVGGPRHSYVCEALGPNHAIGMVRDQHPEMRVVVLKVKKLK